MYLMGRILERRVRHESRFLVHEGRCDHAAVGGEDLRFEAMDYGDYTDSLHWLLRSVQVDPRNAEAWYDLAERG